MKRRKDVCKLFVFFLVLFSAQAYAQKKTKKIIKYKKYESFDLGSLEIKGSIVAPGDITIQERNRRRFRSLLFEKPHF
jgi:hypothetical protein